MDPAQAMGTFLGVWRQKWASLSQAQLAIAVSARCPSNDAVTTDMVYAWERGQPPKTSAQLRALTGVMRRHGLVPSEVQSFRQSVFAGLAARQYPDMFADDGLAHREDVDELALNAWRRASAAPGSYDIVRLVALIAELEGAALQRATGAVSRAQARRQEAALAYLVDALCSHHAYSGRRRLSIAQMAALVRHLQAHFGPGGPGT